MAVHPTQRGGQQRAVSRGNRPAPRPTHSCLSVTSSSKATRTSAADSPSCRNQDNKGAWKVCVSPLVRHG